MADYVAIQNANLEPGAPWISSTAFALRDNPEAIAQGSAGAPRIQTAAIEGGAITTPKIANSSVNAGKLANGTPERDWVLARTASASHGAVGTYAMLGALVPSGASSLVQGDTLPGSSLRYASASSSPGNSSPSGTWRLMGRCQSTIGTIGSSNISVWLRIS